LFCEHFTPENVIVQSYGNVLSAISFLHGLAMHELCVEELDYYEPGYDVSITVRATKEQAP
jgi:hypothetical protein